MKFEVGVIEDLPFEEYNEIPAYRASDLKEADRCMFTWKNKKGFSESPALLEGRVQHTIFLELHNFDKEFVISPKFDRRTKLGKQECEDFENSIGNRTAITQTMYDNCMDRREVVSKFIPKPEHKVELTVCFMWNGHPFKSRLDWYDGVRPWDLKTCRDGSPRGFKSAINGFRYYMQAALYVDACRAVGLPADGFSFLAQEKLHPYPYAVYDLTPEALAYGQSKNEQALSLILEAKTTNEYHPYNISGVQTIDLDQLW